MKTKKRGHLDILFNSTQTSGFTEINSYEKIIMMIDHMIKTKGARRAMLSLIIKWASICNISGVKLLNRIVEDEIIDTELQDMDEQEGLPPGKKALSPSAYVSVYLARKVSELHSNPKHLSNSKIYQYLFDAIHNAYLSVYNDKVPLNEGSYLLKQTVIHQIGRNYHLDTEVYPGMINSMVKSGYRAFFKKVEKSEKLKDILLDAVQDEDFSFRLTDDYGSEGEITADQYDDAVQGMIL